MDNEQIRELKLRCLKIVLEHTMEDEAVPVPTAVKAAQEVFDWVMEGTA